MRVIHSIEIRDESEVGAARRAVNAFAREAGLADEGARAEIDIVVQEMGTNAVRYAAGGGWIHFTTPSGAAHGVELFYWDKGPGIPDLERAIRDGVSAGGGMGVGLGAMRRLMDEFDIYSTVHEGEDERAFETSPLRASRRRTTHGTAIRCHKWAAGEERLAASAEHEDAAHRIGVWSRPMPGEDANGDAYYLRRRGARTLVVALDGLGHGPGARAAAEAALGVLDQWAGEALDELFRETHDALRATRGAVMGAVVVDEGAGEFSCAGVGNVETRVFGAPAPARPVSNNGTLGARFERLRVWSYPWAEGTTILLATDGISNSWDAADYPGLLQKSPQMLAGVLMRDYGRDTDDATVIVYR
ncbi:MAG: ATP-binding protein [Pyrinomonadaceae bacterium]